MLAMRGGAESTVMVVFTVPAEVTTPTLSGLVVGVLRRRTATCATPPAGTVGGSNRYQAGSPALRMSAGGSSQKKKMLLSASGFHEAVDFLMTVLRLYPTRVVSSIVIEAAPVFLMRM